VGRSVNPQTGESDVLVLKTDSKGELEWQRRYGGEDTEVGAAAAQSDDGDIVVGGYTRSYGAGEDDWYALRLNPDGDVIWEQTYGGGHYDQCCSVQALHDGFSLFGYTWSFGAGEKDYWLIRIDADGETLWSRTYGGEDFDFGRAHVQTADGGWALTGYAMSIGNRGKNMGLYRVNEDGDEIWARAYGGDANDDAFALIQTADGGFALAGYTILDEDNPDDMDGWLVKTDADGELQWNALYSGNRQESWNDLKQLPDGGYILIGTTDSQGAGSHDMLTARYNADGELLWSQTYGGRLTDRGVSVTVSEEGYTYAGNTMLNGEAAVWLIQTEPEGDERAAFTVFLNSGWNIVGSPVAPAPPNLEVVWQPVIDRRRLIVVKDINNRLFLPAADENAIGDWDVRWGYLVKMTVSDSLAVEGQPTPVDTPIPLSAGWTMASYLPENPQWVETALEGLGDNLLLARDEYGRFYAPHYSFSNMGRLHRGKGYFIHVAEDCELVWAEGDSAQARLADAEWTPPSHFLPLEPGLWSMSLIVRADDRFDVGRAELGAFSRENRCLGAVVLKGNGPWGFSISEGITDSAEVTFRLWRKGVETDADAVWIEDEGLTDGLAIININRDAAAVPFNTSGELPPAESGILTAAPNPFNSQITLTFDAPLGFSTILTVTNLAGRVVYCYEWTNTAGGVQTVSIDGLSWAAGWYLVRLQAGDWSASRKLALLR